MKTTNRNDFLFHLLFIAAFSYFFVDLKLDETLFQPPHGVHQWRQTDGASMALVFAQENNSLFEPKLLNQFKGDGSAGGEFPITYFMAGKWYQWFGFSHAALRIIHFVLFFTSMLLTLQVLFRVFHHRASAVAAIFLLLCSATFMNYAVSPLTDATAFGFALLASALLYDQKREGNSVKFWVSAGLFALAGLLKISMLLPFFAVVGAFVIDDFRAKHFLRMLKRWLPYSVSVLIPVASWYVYIAEYNAAHEGDYFTTTIRPFWDLTSTQFSAINSHILSFWRQIIFSNWIVAILIVSILLLLSNSKKWRWFESSLIVLLAVGSMVYFFLFFVSLEHHDYYYIPFFFLIIALFTAAIVLLESLFFKTWLRIFGLIGIGFICWHTAHAAVVNTRRSYQGWFHDMSLSESLFDIASFLDANNIPTSSKFVVPQDESSNSSLYFLNRPGYTKLTGIFDVDDLDPLIDQGVEYALVLDTSFYSVTFLKYHITDTIGYHHELGIYKVGHSKWWNPEAEGLSE